MVGDTRRVELTAPGDVWLRLIEPPPKIARALGRRFTLGPAAGALGSGDEPDVTVRFARLARPAGLVTLGNGAVGFAGDDFHLLDELDGAVLATMPFDAIGQRPVTVSCAATARAVPFLEELLLTTLLARGWAPLHASAVEHDGEGVVLMGWPKGGKTGAMLGYMKHGAAFVGDEWLALSADGQRVHGVSDALSVAYWQLDHLPLDTPHRRRRVTSGIVRIAEATNTALRRADLDRTAVGKLVRRGLPGLRRQLKVSIDPTVAFGGRVRSHTTTPATMFLLVAHADEHIAARTIASDTAAARMAHANVFEQRDFLHAYRAFQFAFPHRANPLLDRVHAAQAEVLRSVFDRRHIVEIRHPYGRPVDGLFHALQDVVHGSTATA